MVVWIVVASVLHQLILDGRAAGWMDVGSKMTNP